MSQVNEGARSFVQPTIPRVAPLPVTFFPYPARCWSCLLGACTTVIDLRAVHVTALARTCTRIGQAHTGALTYEDSRLIRLDLEADYTRRRPTAGYRPFELNAGYGINSSRVRLIGAIRLNFGTLARPRNITAVSV